MVYNHGDVETITENMSLKAVVISTSLEWYDIEQEDTRASPCLGTRGFSEEAMLELRAEISKSQLAEGPNTCMTFKDTPTPLGNTTLRYKVAQVCAV